MDHAINALKPYYEAEMDCLRDEWRTGEYKRIHACPSYKAAKAIHDAIVVMERYEYGNKRTLSPAELVR